MLAILHSCGNTAVQTLGKLANRLRCIEGKIRQSPFSVFESIHLGVGPMKDPMTRKPWAEIFKKPNPEAKHPSPETLEIHGGVLEWIREPRPSKKGFIALHQGRYRCRGGDK